MGRDVLIPARNISASCTEPQIEQSTLSSVQWPLLPSLSPLIPLPVLFWPKHKHNNINHRSVCSQNEKTKPAATRASVLRSKSQKHTQTCTQTNTSSYDSLELSSCRPESHDQLFLYCIYWQAGRDRPEASCSPDMRKVWCGGWAWKGR